MNKLRYYDSLDSCDSNCEFSAPPLFVLREGANTINTVANDQGQVRRKGDSTGKTISFASAQYQKNQSIFRDNMDDSKGTNGTVVTAPSTAEFSENSNNDYDHHDVEAAVSNKEGDGTVHGEAASLLQDEGDCTPVRSNVITAPVSAKGRHVKLSTPFQQQHQPQNQNNNSDASAYINGQISIEEENQYLKDELAHMRNEMRKWKSLVKQQRHKLTQREQTNQGPQNWIRKLISGGASSSSSTASATSPVTVTSCSSEDSNKNTSIASKNSLRTHKAKNSFSSDDDEMCFDLDPSSDDEQQFDEYPGLHHRHSSSSHNSHSRGPKRKMKTTNVQAVFRNEPDQDENVSLLKKITENLHRNRDKNEEGMHISLREMKQTPKNDKDNNVGMDRPVKSLNDDDSIIIVGDNDDNDSTVYHELENMTFYSSLYDRAVWLVGLLVLQSLSSFILAQNEELLQHHTVIVQFLTMLVGAGGNAGNQSSVRVIRGLAVGNVNDRNLRSYVSTEFLTAVLLCFILGLAGYVRAVVFQIPLKETIAITSSLVMIVMSSIIIGTSLPLLMKWLGIDPAHSSTTIQVLMDILGVTITLQMSTIILGS